MLEKITFSCIFNIIQQYMQDIKMCWGDGTMYIASAVSRIV